MTIFLNPSSCNSSRFAISKQTTPLKKYVFSKFYPKIKEGKALSLKLGSINFVSKRTYFNISIHLEAFLIILLLLGLLDISYFVL